MNWDAQSVLCVTTDARACVDTYMHTGNSCVSWVLCICRHEHVFCMPLPQSQTQHKHTNTHTPSCSPSGSQDDINSDNVPAAQWILELLTMPSARLDPIIKVSSKETNWISAGICNWKLAFNDALWSRAEPSVGINQTSLRRNRLDCVVRCGINIIRGIKFIWSYKVANLIPSVTKTLNPAELNFSISGAISDW